MIKSVSVPARWAARHPYQLFAPLVALLLVAAFEQTRLAEILEDQSVNARFRVRAPWDPPPDPRLIFVGIDQQSLDYIGRWPWPRLVEAYFLNGIADADVHPRVVAFDLLFSDDYEKLHNVQSTIDEAKNDEMLAQAADKLPSVITGSLSIPPQNQGADEADAKRTKDELSQPSLTPSLTHIAGDLTKVRGSDIAAFPVHPLRKVSLYGFVNDEKTSIDGIRRTVPMLVRVQDKLYPSLALQVLCQMLSVDPDNVDIHIGEYVKLTNASGKSWTIPIDAAGQYAINYRQSIDRNNVSFFRLFQNLQAKAEKGTPLPAECDIDKKVLLIGQAAVGLTDLGPTPYNGIRALGYIHLDVINNVLQRDYLSFVPLSWVVIGWLIVTWATLFRLTRAPLVESVVLPLNAIFFYSLFAVAIFWIWSIRITMVWPLLSYGGVSFGAIVLRWMEENRAKTQLRQMFSQMTSPDVMEHLLAHPTNLKLGGSKRAVTILFLDIRDYTTFSEGMDEEELIRQLNEFFERMVNCVIKYQGTVHKFMGDAVMAVWGDIAAVSRGNENDAKNAVRASLLMRHELRSLNQVRQAAKLIPLRIGIGLNHGTVVVGQIGATIRSEFACIGDAVNVASRLEGITKIFHTDLAVGESVRALLGDGFLARRLGLVLLKGKNTPTVVYEVLAERTDLSASAMKEEAVVIYEKAFDHFLARRFKEAEAAFLACESIQPGDYCAQRYRQACREFLSTPPPAEWDGRIVMESK
jgi:adenylate cyclase